MRICLSPLYSLGDLGATARIWQFSLYACMLFTLGSGATCDVAPHSWKPRPHQLSVYQLDLAYRISYLTIVTIGLSLRNTLFDYPIVCVFVCD